MDTALGRVAAARRPPSVEAGPRPRLVCLASPRLESFGQTLALAPRQESEPVQLLLRVVAAGVEGLPVGRLCAALWPTDSAREGRHRMNDCLRCLALLLGIAKPPVCVRGDFATVDESLLEVDSLALERTLSPLLDAFQPPSTDQVTCARALLGHALATECVFLPGYEEAWAGLARSRIADAMARAARRLASSPLPKLSPKKGEHDENR